MYIAVLAALVCTSGTEDLVKQISAHLNDSSSEMHIEFFFFFGFVRAKQLRLLLIMTNDYYICITFCRCHEKRGTVKTLQVFSFMNGWKDKREQLLK